MSKELTFPASFLSSSDRALWIMFDNDCGVFTRIPFRRGIIDRSTLTASHLDRAGGDCRRIPYTAACELLTGKSLAEVDLESYPRYFENSVNGGVWEMRGEQASDGMFYYLGRITGSARSLASLTLDPGVVAISAEKAQALIAAASASCPNRYQGA